MAKLGEFFESQGKDVDPIVSEISIMRQLIKEHVHPLDLVRELLSNAGAREVGAAEIHINYYINQDGHVFEVTDNGCGMSYTGNKALPGRLDRFLGLGLSSIVGIKSDEFSWKGLGSKLAYQSKRVEIETFTEGEAEVYKVEIGDPWGTIERNVIPRPRIYRFPPYPGQKPGTKITVVGHPPHRKEKPFTAAELETFLLHRTFAGFTRERETRPSIVLTAQGEEKELSFGFPELRAAKECDGTQLVNEACTAKKAGTNRQFEVRLKGFYTWDADKYGLSTPSLNTGLIVSVKGIPYFAMDMEEFGSQSLRTANPGEKKCCLIVECDAIQEEMNLARSGIVDSEMTDMLKKAVASMFRDIESSQKYFAFRQVSVKRKTVESAASLHDKKRALESADQNWVTYTDANGNVILLGREPENEFDTLNLLWKMEATKALPFTRFQTLGHSHKGVDLIVHFQEDGESNPERYTVVEAERFFYNYEPHGHNPAQYVRVVCWDLGNKTKLKVEDTPKRHKKVAQAQDGVSVHVFCIKHMPGISVISRRKAEDMKLL